MKAPGETSQDEVSSSGANGVAPSQKRRPPKLAKSTTPSDGQSAGSQQRYGGPERSNRKKHRKLPNGVAHEQRESSLNTSSEEQISDEPNTSPRAVMHHQSTTVRRESAQSAEPDQVQVVGREQRSNSPAQVRETRVQHMLSPEVDGQIVQAPNRHVGQAEGNLTNGTNANAGQVTQTTEAVTKPKGNDQLRLRLDLNLDVEIELKAKIRGDVTLQLLQ
ncbi:uncharacterized protein N7477_006851 [Penicillium maclennaniae]|uniref:uncharacterized protein n=1 Tax=Penicillium maclennaniae TaxID=1343394 RepID=UPI00254008D7|nr:uncharacterized protein N7477_006851 [Penicillium maclennaniae]KAJ5668281.1 hypothetical protein N7477_006851 [Penicillium maclennaniae]